MTDLHGRTFVIRFRITFVNSFSRAVDAISITIHPSKLEHFRGYVRFVCVIACLPDFGTFWYVVEISAKDSENWDGFEEKKRKRRRRSNDIVIAWKGYWCRRGSEIDAGVEVRATSVRTRQNSSQKIDSGVGKKTKAVSERRRQLRTLETTTGFGEEGKVRFVTKRQRLRLQTDSCFC